jgi:hypothetical protein
MQRPSRKCADVGGFCAFYDKCPRYHHEYVGENHGGRSRRQALLFDKYAAAWGKNGATIAYFIAAPVVAADADHSSFGCHEPPSGPILATPFSTRRWPHRESEGCLYAGAGTGCKA